MTRNQKLATIVFVFFVLAVMLINYTTKVSQAIPNRVEEMYSEESSTNTATGRIRIYHSDTDPLTTVENLENKLGRPYDSNLDEWKLDAERDTKPILLLYDDYVVSIEGQYAGGSQIEVTNHETGYDRHHTHFVHFWGPTVRRGSIFNGGIGKVRGGGIGGIGGK